MSKATKSVPLWMVVAGVAAAGAALLRRKPRASNNRGSQPQRPLPAPPTETPAPSPFERGSRCTRLASDEEVERWLEELAAPLIVQRVNASPVLDGDGAMETLRLFADEVFVETTGHCSSAQTDAAKQVRRWLWCEVTIQFIRQAKIDDEEDDIVRLCADPTFDPWTFDPDARQPEPEPTSPRPVPLPSRPLPGPMDGSSGATPTETTPSNLQVLASRPELSDFGVRRLMEGSIDGVPVAAPVRHVVMLAVNPSWARVERARADLRIVAQRHPRVQFIEVSLADTQRHFGTPEHLDQVAWILAASGPTGRAFAEPMVREGLSGSAPDAEQWNKVITHASGFVGAAPPRAIPRPKKPGDLIRAMARHARGSVGRTHSRFQRTTQRHRSRP